MGPKTLGEGNLAGALNKVRKMKRQQNRNGQLEVQNSNRELLSLERGKLTFGETPARLEPGVATPSSSLSQVKHLLLSTPPWAQLVKKLGPPREMLVSKLKAPLCKAGASSCSSSSSVLKLLLSSLASSGLKLLLASSASSSVEGVLVKAGLAKLAL